jgi:hypothetical protein
MFKLRKEHLDAFEAQVVKLFAERLQVHLKAVWPAECKDLGDGGLAELVPKAIQRAAALGLSSEFDVVRFVDLYFLLGLEFETNPLAGWTRPILGDPALRPTARMDMLYLRMEDEFNLIEKRRRGRS